MSIPAKEMVAYVEALLAQPKQHCPIVGLQGDVLPPLGEPWRKDLITTINEQQRVKWRKKWQEMDELECTQEHYKHYEWECRKAFEELERREDHVRDLIAALTELRAFMWAEGYADQAPEMAKADAVLAKGGKQ